MHYCLSPYSSRNQFSMMMSEREFDVAVEVGTHRGDYANILLTDWQGKLYCVDPWCDVEGYEYQAQILIDHLHGNKERLRDLERAKSLLNGKNVTFIQKLSVDAAEEFEDSSVDFIYIDGNHEEPYVYEDLVTWWPKLRPGGVLAGHDIITPGECETGWSRGIQSAVSKFGEDMSLICYLVQEEGGLPWSYYMEKLQ